MKNGGRRRMRRPGAMMLALLFGSAAAALALTLRYHLGVPGLVVTLLLGLPGLYLGWVPLQDARRPPERSLVQIADGLAGLLRTQWAEEAVARGLNDPYPLPVTWTAADAPLAGDLDALKTLATSGAGWSATAQENWAKGPEDLAGGGDRKLADVLATVPTGRLVVLGERGAGKTMLMVGLVLDLLHPDRRSGGGPVPVLASLASWDPVSQDLHGWLGATLITDYPDLGAAAPPGSAGDNRFESLLEAGLIVPVLDGLDEVPESARPVAITRINKELKPGEQVVVICRTEQYRATVSPQDGQGAVLRAAAVQLCTLEFDQVARYLRKDAGPPAQGRWDFLNGLSTESPVRQALATPLMAGLARAIYNPDPDDPDDPGERGRELRHPAVLCNFADRAAVEAHLFDAFISAAYRHDSPGRWKAQDAERWLVFLARHLERKIGRPDLAWWQLREATPRTVIVLTGLLLASLAGFLAGFLVGGLGAGLTARLVAGLIFGLGAGLAFEVIGGFVSAVGLSRAKAAHGMRTRLVALLTVRYGDVPVSAEAPARGMRMSTSGLILGLGAGLAVGLIFGLATGPRAGLGAGLYIGLLFGLGAGLAGAPGDPAGATSPRAVLARDRRVALRLKLVLGLVFGLAAGIASGIASGLTAGLVYGLEAGLGGLLVAGRGLSMTQTAWPAYVVAKGWLALHRRLPWSLMDFLANAHQRGVLRQAGAVYQFRHIDLQHRLATRP